MATWTNIPDSVLEPGKPARSVDALALRDNAIAIAEGAAGAPKVTENAMSANSIHGNRLRSGTVTNTQIANMDAGKLNSGTVPGARIPTAHGGVGTYAFVRHRIGAATWGQTVAGSNLFTSSTGGGASVTLAGTWRVMGSRISFGDSESTVAVRIS